jgi:PDZ domain
MLRPSHWFLLVAAGVGSWTCHASAQPADAAPPKTTSPAAAKPGNEKSKPGKPAEDPLEYFRKGDYARAETLLREQIAAQPENFVPLYNLACCRSMSRDADGAVELLSKAIEKGFCDAHYLRRDAALDPIRGDARFKAILEHWSELLEARRAANLAQAEAAFAGQAYTNASDDKLRLSYRSAFNERAFASAREEVRRVADFAQETLFPDLFAMPAAKDDAWVTVILPTRADFMRWAVSVYGPDVVNATTSTIGGAYEHDAKRLVSMDLGATLRHEFLHVLHWRDNTRRGQSHPIWIQEGLASLVEDVEVQGGKLVPVASWRTNIAQRLEKLHKLMPIETLAAMPAAKFSSQRPLANYAQARAVFLYLHAQGKLRAWYERYVADWEKDPTGLQSLLAVTESTEKEFDVAYHAWLRALEPVPETIAKGAASLGLDVDSGNGEGPVVSLLDPRARNMPDSRTMLTRGDVIISIDGKPTRDTAELVRVLGAYKVGDRVTVEYRRVRKFASTTVELVPRK